MVKDVYLGGGGYFNKLWNILSVLISVVHSVNIVLIDYVVLLSNYCSVSGVYFIGCVS